MLFQAPGLVIYTRIIAVLALFLGLSDAARLLGVGTGATSPIAIMGFSGFAYLAIFALARLFAAVGLWINASWGAVLLVATTAVELGLHLAGTGDLRMSTIGFGLRIALLVAILVIFGLSLRFHRAQAD
ncbi:MAG: hypothetical protein ABS75_11655 [Pelagibacterium sp. SCN 63-23]|nr:MAG: hypothetical protein ABS75_11655 [Pelagibacterium sp. SCN 63-23]